MDFRFDEDQLAMRDAVRSLCGDHFDLTRVAERDGAPLDEATWAALVELGIIGMLAPDSGFGLVEATVVLEELGAHLASGPVLWSVLAAPFVPGVAEGEVRVTGIDLDAVAGGPIVVENGPEADLLLVLRGDRAELVRLADVAGAAPGTSIDPLTPTTILPALPAGEVVLEGAAVEQLRRDGRILTAAFLVGRRPGRARRGEGLRPRPRAVRRADRLVPGRQAPARRHVRPRRDWPGPPPTPRPPWPTDLGEGDADLAVPLGQAPRRRGRHANGRVAVQVLGGMGFTWEMLPHYFLKRALVLDQSFGTSSSQAARIGAAVGRRGGVGMSGTERPRRPDRRRRRRAAHPPRPARAQERPLDRAASRRIVDALEAAATDDALRAVSIGTTGPDFCAGRRLGGVEHQGRRPGRAPAASSAARRCRPTA